MTKRDWVRGLGGIWHVVDVERKPGELVPALCGVRIVPQPEWWRFKTDGKHDAKCDTCARCLIAGLH
jgi:hypothetical protein